MEVRILGSGSKGNCYWVSDGESAILLDCGLPFAKIQQGIDFDVSGLYGCLITHEHADHSKAVRDMLKRGVDCYMSEGTQRALAVQGHRITTAAWDGARYKVMHIEKKWNVLPFATKHDGAEPLGFLIKSNKTDERLLYVTDTCYVPNRFDDLNYIMIEINYIKEVLDKNVDDGIIDSSLRNRIVKTHMSMETALGFFRANDLSKVREIVLLHLSDANSDARRILEAVQKATGRIVKIA